MEPLITTLSAAEPIPIGSPPAAPAVGPTFDEHLDRARRPSPTDRRTWSDAPESSAEHPSTAAPAPPPVKKPDAAKRKSTTEPADLDVATGAAPSDQEESNDAEKAQAATAAAAETLALQNAPPVATPLVVPTKPAPSVSPLDAEPSEPSPVSIDPSAIESPLHGQSAAARPRTGPTRAPVAANLDAESLPPDGETPSTLVAAPLAEPDESQRGVPAAKANDSPPLAAGAVTARGAKRSASDRATQTANSQSAAPSKASTKGGAVEPAEMPPIEAAAFPLEEHRSNVEPSAQAREREVPPHIELPQADGQHAANSGSAAMRGADSHSAAAADMHRIDRADAPRDGASAADAAASGGHNHSASAATDDRARFVERVARAFHAADQRGGPVRLRLSPPELGAVRVEVEIRDGALSARLEAETAEARSLLLEGLPQLRERLASQNLRLDRFDVELSNGSSSHSSGEHTRHGADGERGAASFVPRHEARRAGRESAVAAVAHRRTGEGGLDVVI